MKIRKTKIDDNESILEIIEDSYSEYLDIIPGDYTYLPSMNFLHDLLGKENTLGLVVEIEKKPIAICIGVTYHSSIFHLSMLYVKKKHQKKKLGRILLEALTNQVLSQHCSVLTTNAQTWAPWSKNFYLKNGFVIFREGEEEYCDTFTLYINNRRKINKLNDNYKILLWKGLLTD